MGSIHDDIALLKAHVKGYYRRNPKTGKREHVKPHKTKTRKTRPATPGAKTIPGPEQIEAIGRLRAQAERHFRKYENALAQGKEKAALAALRRHDKALVEATRLSVMRGQGLQTVKVGGKPTKPAAATPTSEPGGQQSFDKREKYPDGRLKPREGDQVYQVVGGPFGGAEIVGTVYRSKSSGKLRVKLITRSAGTIIGRVPVRGKHYALNEYWTVKGDPAPAKAAGEKTRKYEEEKAAIEKFYSEGLPQSKARLKKEGHKFLDEVAPVKGMVVEDVGRAKPGTAEPETPRRGVVKKVWQSTGYSEDFKVTMVNVLWEGSKRAFEVETYRGKFGDNDPYGAEYKYFRVVKKKKK